MTDNITLIENNINVSEDEKVSEILNSFLSMLSKAVILTVMSISLFTNIFFASGDPIFREIDEYEKKQVSYKSSKQYH